MGRSIMPQERILVTGGAGFLGVHLCRRLINEGHRVICLDNFQTSSSKALDVLSNEPRFTVIEHDVIDPLPKNLRPTQIYNLACAASPVRYQSDPVHTLRTCVNGAFNVLELGAASDARVLQASTSEVYGNPDQHPQSEQYHGNVNTVGVRSCYDEGKRCAETLFADYQRKKDLDVKIARIFNTYGPGMSPTDGRVVSNFVTQALSGNRLTIYGDGTQTRSLCYVSDMIEGLVRLMGSTHAFSGPVNLGNAHEVTVLEIAHRICSLLGVEPVLTFETMPADDPVRRCPDTNVAKSVIGWEPQVDLNTGLAKTISYFSAFSLPRQEVGPAPLSK